MAITLANGFKTAALDGGLAAINGGTGDTTGDLEFLSAADASLAVLAMNATAFAASTISGVNAVASSNAIAASGTPTPGTIAKGRLRNKANVAIISFSVSLAGGGGDMISGATVIPSGATSVSCSGITMTAAFA
jgi:hypothetical protein